MSLLNEAEIAEKLTQLPTWERRESTIVRSFSFGSFAQAMAFVNRVAEVAERADHHPDIVIHYTRVTLTLWSHDEGGLTRRDFRLAQQIDGLSE